MKAKILIPNSEHICTKGNGRIFVQSEEDRERVIELLKEFDPNEFEGYYPEGLVTVFNPDGDNRLIYTHKFDISSVREFVSLCQQHDIYVVVYSCNEYNYDDLLTVESHLQMRLGFMRYVGDFVYNKTKDQ